MKPLQLTIVNILRPRRNKWPPACRRHFRILQWRWYYFDSNYVPMIQITINQYWSSYNGLAPNRQKMSLTGPMIAKVDDAYMRHSASVGKRIGSRTKLPTNILWVIYPSDNKLALDAVMAGWRRRQTISQTNVDQPLWRHMSSLGHNRLTIQISKILYLELLYFYQLWHCDESASEIVAPNGSSVTLYVLFFFRENINIYLHFVSFLHSNETQVVDIPPRVRQGPAYS